MAVICLVLAVAASACGSGATPAPVDVEAAGGDPEMIATASSVYGDPTAEDVPWHGGSFELIGFARSAEAAVVAFGGQAPELGDDEVLAVVRVVETRDGWGVRGSLLACRGEDLGMSFAFPDDDAVPGFVVALYAERGDEIPHGGMAVRTDDPMLAWTGTVDADHPVEYTGQSTTGRFCR